MSKELTPLEALEKRKDCCDCPYGYCEALKQEVCPCDIIEKALKALEIIKEKGLHYLEVALIQSNCSYEEYLMECNRTIDIGLISKPLFDCKPKTKEEYDLLKEVLL